MPTEAEWEYAARAGTTGEFGGTGIADDMGWYLTIPKSGTHPVAQKQPNAWGLYDMHGNVKERVQDWYSDDYYSVSPADDPQGPASGVFPTGLFRVLRGGSYSAQAATATSAWRSGADVTHAVRDRGFRLVQTR